MPRKSLILGAALAATTLTSVALAGQQLKQFGDEQAMIELFHDIMGLVQTSAEVADDETASGVAAIFAVEDHLGNGEEAIAFFEEMLDETESDAIRRAIRIKLSELYQKNGQGDEALEQLAELIKADD